MDGETNPTRDGGGLDNDPSGGVDNSKPPIIPDLRSGFDDKPGGGGGPQPGGFITIFGDRPITPSLVQNTTPLDNNP